jgi:hypothetical protein
MHCCMLQMLPRIVQSLLAEILIASIQTCIRRKLLKILYQILCFCTIGGRKTDLDAIAN